MERDTLFARVIEQFSQSLNAAMPGSQTERLAVGLKEALNAALTEIELVPRRELEGHLEALKGLRARVLELEARVRSLEQANAAEQAPEQG